MLADSQGRTFRIVARPATGVKRLGVSPSGLSVILSPVKRDIEVDPSTTVQVSPTKPCSVYQMTVNHSVYGLTGTWPKLEMYVKTFLSGQEFPKLSALSQN
ncbi:RNA-binding motif single-stranded-interacting protein 1 [Biomphalaria pfeifferi]|uniref:RNA-binding motif single-stranded-interacting protein 1 n=1 Tax=Biomphalaria pfeifferi TaxID=112525 RepID=A0AAD8CBS2_BIOPF|nr:RNA-binding motif single-stranded-interacting protein 1 [Biomphalaria pfeifferi]